MERSGIRENPGFRPDGLHPGYGFFVQPLRIHPRRTGAATDDRRAHRLYSRRRYGRQSGQRHRQFRRVVVLIG